MIKESLKLKPYFSNFLDGNVQEKKYINIHLLILCESLRRVTLFKKEHTDKTNIIKI